MSSVTKTISLAEYHTRNQQAEFKSEYYRGEMFAMAGGSPMHSLIAANFIGEARESLKEKFCTVFSSDLRIKIVATGLCTYPDASIVCGEMEYHTELPDTVTNPTLLVEVLSPSTENYDRGKKSEHYRQIESLQEIVLIAQDRPRVERFMRQDRKGWLLLEETDLESSVDFDSVGVTIRMSEIYRDVKFVQKW